MALREVTPAEARQAIFGLEQAHSARREWVWARLGAAPLAMALPHLLSLARLTERNLSGDTVAEIADAYTTWGWQVDAAVLDALAAVEAAQDVTAVKAAIRPIYQPWLGEGAEVLQKAVAVNPAQAYSAPPPITAEPGACILFSDALRYDVGQRLAADLESRGLVCERSWRLAALPTVTPTAKAAVSPVASQISGNRSSDLAPRTIDTGSVVDVSVLRNLLAKAGYQILAGDELGDPAGRAWTELGAIDRYGHDHGWKVARHVQAEIRLLTDRVAALLEHGWQQVMIVTDHGWLLLPGGLPKAEIPLHLTLLRKGRCAVLKNNAKTDHQVVPWYWDRDVRVAVAPGIRCYEAGQEYEHGGVSPQECFVPMLLVSRRDHQADQEVAITNVGWRGLRCTLEISKAAPGMAVDIRRRAGDASTSLVTTPKAIDADGATSVLVEDDDAFGAEAMIVVLTADGEVFTQARTIVGG